MIEFATGFDPQRVQVFACVLRKPSALGRRLRAEGVPLRFLGYSRFNPLSIYTLVKLIYKHHIDVLHLTDYGASTFGRLAGLITGTPTLVHVRSHHSEYQARGFPRYVEFVYRVLAPHTARALAISNSVRQFAIERMGFRPDQVETLHNALAERSLLPASPEEVEDVRRLYGIDPQTPVIGATTRFHPSKGIHVLLEAVPLVLRDVPTARVLLLGGGPEQARLEEQVRRLGITDHVIFAGFQRNVTAFRHLFWVTAMPSLEEGFGNVAVESMALGLPVIASRLGGLVEIISDGVNGLLVEPENPPQLATALVRVLKDPVLRNRLGSAARLESQRYSMSSYLARLEDIYRTLVTNLR